MEKQSGREMERRVKDLEKTSEMKRCPQAGCESSGMNVMSDTLKNECVMGNVVDV